MVLGWDPRLTSTSPSVGELLANCEAKLMDDDGVREVPQGQRGEFWCRAPNVMKGYWKNPEATRETITDDGWLKTGDVAYIDSDGMYHIVERKKASSPKAC
jgi:4-coumarate--CoA ligase